MYRLGTVDSSVLRDDLNKFWLRLKGKDLKSFAQAEENDRTSASSSNYIWSLKDVNFSVQEGEVLGIIGKNGAGKSTLLKLLSKVTAPTSGTIRMKGRVASLLEVGTGFHPELTGRENIYLNGAILGMKKQEIKTKFDEIVAFAGVERYVDTPVKRYSSGMYVRLAFAVAAHLEPEILIVDEVLAVGDAEFQKKCLGKMKDVSSQGRTILFVSHNLNAVQSLCSRAIVLKNGAKIFDGSSQDAVNHYNLSSLIMSRKAILNIDNEYIKIEQLTVNPDQEVIYESDNLEVEIQFKTKPKFDRNIHLTLHLKNEMDQIICTFSNIFTDVRISSTDTKLIFKLGKDLLLSGAYSFDLLVVLHGNSVIEHVCDVVSFGLEQKPKSSIIFGREPGIFNPPIKCEIY
jgi:lipopolysaccharide transport system ATP-binding protein